MKIFDSWASWAEAQHQLETDLPDDTLETLNESFLFAITCHGEQTRPNGEPYIIHLLEVVEILVKGATILDKEILVAGALHDVVEDTACSLDEIEARFGDKVVDIVRWLTKPAQNQGESTEQVKKKYFTQLQTAPMNAIIVKLADRLSNVQKIDTHPRLAKQKAYYRETIKEVLPFAERVPWFKSQFQMWREKFQFLAE